MCGILDGHEQKTVYTYNFHTNGCVCVSVMCSITWRFVDISSEQPISCFLGVGAGEVKLPKVGHVKHGYSISTG